MKISPTNSSVSQSSFRVLASLEGKNGSFSLALCFLQKEGNVEDSNFMDERGGIRNNYESQIKISLFQYTELESGTEI